MDDIIDGGFNFEVIEPGGVSTEGTALGTPKSKVEIIFNAVPDRWSALSIKFRDDPFPFTFYEQFQYVRYATGGQTNPTIYHSVAEATTKEGSAYNYYKALIGGGHIYDQGDLAKEGLANLFVVTYVAGTNKVTVTAVDDCVKFENWITNTDITVNITNQDCSTVNPPPAITGSLTLTPGDIPCTHVKVSVQSSRLLVDIKTPVAVYPNADNPFLFEILRGNLLTNFSAAETFNGPLYSWQFYSPAVLDVNKFVLSITNKSNSASVSVTNTITQSTSYPLTFAYKLDNALWTKQTTFEVPLGSSHTMHIKDQYGCEVSIPFIVTDFQDMTPTTVLRKYCGGLHELNKGKFLNLFGKQHTMKIGIVVNADPKSVKIFKNLQMILNTNYAVKNIDIKTSMGQQRFVPGEHFRYFIKEGMHTVPLKNPHDWDDLRGSYAYIEIEIESIDNKKVDLSSIITHLRKSTL